MAISIDLSGKNTIAQLTQAVESANINGPLDSVVAIANSSAGALASSMADGCNLFGTISGLLKNAAFTAKSYVSSFTSSFASMASGIQGQIGGALKNLANMVNQVKALFAKSLAGIKSMISDVKGFISTTVGDIVETVTETVNELGETIRTITTSASAAATALFNELKAKISGVVAGMNSVMASVTSYATGLMNTVKGAVSGMLKSMVGCVKSLVAFNCSTASSAIKGAANIDGLAAMKGVVGAPSREAAVKSSLSSVSGSMLNAGNALKSMSAIDGGYATGLENNISGLKLWTSVQ